MLSLSYPHSLKHHLATCIQSSPVNGRIRRNKVENVIELKFSIFLYFMRERKEGKRVKMELCVNVHMNFVIIYAQSSLVDRTTPCIYIDVCGSVCIYQAKITLKCISKREKQHWLNIYIFTITPSYNDATGAPCASSHSHPHAIDFICFGTCLRCHLQYFHQLQDVMMSYLFVHQPSIHHISLLETT